MDFVLGLVIGVFVGYFVAAMAWAAHQKTPTPPAADVHVLDDTQQPEVTDETEGTARAR